MAKAADSTCKVSDMRIILKEQRTTKAMDTMPTNVDEELFPLYEEVSDHCSDEIAGIWSHCLSMAVFRESLSVLLLVFFGSKEFHRVCKVPQHTL
jgi:hypothetical protein